MASEKRNVNKWCVLLLVAALLPACKPTARAEQRREQEVASDVILTVSNQSKRAVQISLQWDTLAHVLGEVPSRMVRSFSVPSALVGSRSILRLAAGGDDGLTLRSEDFRMQRGQQVTWTVADNGPGTLLTR